MNKANQAKPPKTNLVHIKATVIPHSGQDLLPGHPGLPLHMAAGGQAPKVHWAAQSTALHCTLHCTVQCTMCFKMQYEM